MFGHSEVGLRSLSVLAGVLATAGVMYAARLARDPLSGLFAGLLFATSTFQIQYSQEARPYALLAAAATLVLCSVLLLDREIRSSSAKDGLSGRAILFAVLTGISLSLVCWLHNLGAAFAASSGAVMAARGLCGQQPSRSRWIRATVIAGSTALVATLPLFPMLASQTGNSVAASFWVEPITLEAVLNTVSSIFGVEYLWLPKLSEEVVRFALLTVLVGLFVVGLLDTWRRGRRVTTALMFATAFLPLLIVIAVSAAVRPILLPRTLIFSGAPFLIGVALGIRALPQRTMFVVMGALVALFLKGAYGYFETFSKEPWRETVQKIRDEARSGDIEILVPNSTSLPFDYYKSMGGAFPASAVPIPASFPAPGSTAPTGRHPWFRRSSAMTGRS